MGKARGKAKDKQEETRSLTALFDKGIRKVRLPEWNEWAYIEMFADAHGKIRVWCKLYDIGCDGADILISQIDGPLYLPWAPPENYSERREEIYSPPPSSNVEPQP